MEATLKYTLPEDNYDFECAHNGWRYRSELRDLQENLRRLRKHGYDFTDADMVIEDLWDRFVVNGINLDED